MPIHVKWDESLWEPITEDIPDAEDVIRSSFRKGINRENSFYDYQPLSEQYEIPGVSSYPTFD